MKNNAFYYCFSTFSLRNIFCFVLTAGLFLVASQTSLLWATNQPHIKFQTETEKKAPSVPETVDENTIEKRIQDLKKELEAALKETQATNSNPAVKISDSLQSKSLLYQSLISTHERLLTALKKRSSLEKEKQHTQEKAETFTFSDHFPKPPYALSLYDKLLNERLSFSQKKANIDLALKVSQKSLDTALEKFETTQKDLRNLKDQLQENKEDVTLQNAIDRLNIEKKLAESNLLLEKTIQYNLTTEQAIANIELSLYERQVPWVEKRLEFDASDLENQVESTKQEREDLTKRLKKIVAEQKTIEDSWIKAQEKAAQFENVETDFFLKSRDAWRKTYQAVLEQTESMIGYLNLKEQLWQYRYSILKGDSPPLTIEKWKKEMEAEHQKLSSTIQLQQNYYMNLQSELSLIGRELSEKTLPDPIKLSVTNQYKAIQKLSERVNEYLAFLFSVEVILNRFIDEVSEFSKSEPVHKRMGQMLGELKSIWNLEVWTIDDRPVTVRKLFTALIILTIGMLITRYMLRYLKDRLSHMASLQETTSATLQKVLSYMAYFLVILFTLRMVNIPLEAFAFLGGAIAIGVGFGAQNLINNFISGFIIMGERPINIGDLIEVEGVLGKVEEIGARCTRIRTGENIDILVPNSSFLEKNITNWTLTDHQIRTSITVGVIYGSPVKDVETLLLNAVKSHGKVLKTPEPFVLFNDFGDNALIFIVHFWIITYRIIERRIIESDIRFKIDALFREAGIVIAFPQTDVHLDATTPIELKFIDKAVENS